MGDHIDVVKNEWLAGFQHVVARVSVEHGQVEIDSPEPETWEAVILRPLQTSDGEELVHPQKDPEEFLRLLPQRIHGTYLFATDVHSDEVCPFLHRPVASIRSIEGSHHPVPA